MSGFNPACDNRPPKRFYDEAEAHDELVWRICEYRRDECKRCPRWFDDPSYGRCKHSCRGMAEEMVALVLASADCEEQAVAVFAKHNARVKGGKARAAKLSPERRTEIARTAAKTRWRA